MTHIHRNSSRFFLPLTIVAVTLLSLPAGMPPVTAEEQTPDGSTNSQNVNVSQASPSQQSVTIAQRQGFVIPEKVDRYDPKQRICLLTPGGPLMVELRLKVDGRPFSAPREEMIDAILQGINPAQDQDPSWDEVIRQPRLAGGRFYRFRNASDTLKRTISTYDINGNGLAERYEIRLFLAINYGGASFGMMSFHYHLGSTSKILFEALDQNSDRLLSGKELAAIHNSLQHLDVDDNEIIEADEIAPPQIYTGRAQPSARYVQPVGVLLPVGPGTDLDLVRKTILARYGRDGMLSGEMIPQSTSLWKQLDQNSNGLIDDDEWNHLNDASPQITLEVNLGPGEGNSSGMTLLHLAEELGSKESVMTVQEGNKLTLVLDSCHLELHCSDKIRRANYEQYAQSIMSRLDQDQNGYLERSELEQMAQGFADQFEIWDANQDGKVYLEEIRATYEELQRPSWDRVLIGGIDQGKAIFEHLDVSGDNRLSLRELHQAEKRLQKFDQNENGQVESDELPITFRVAIGRGDAAYELLRTGTATMSGGLVSIGGARTANNPSPPAEPRWFSGMDRNGDNDLSPREFLGTTAQFAELDADGDGLVSREEALKKNP